MNIEESFNEAYEKVELWRNQVIEEYELEEPIKELTKLGEEGHINSLIVLGKLADLKIIEALINTQANYWFQKAADLGSEYAEFKCLESKLETANFSEIEKALISLGDRGYTLAYTKLGKCYSSGTHVDKDKTKAAPYLKKAADQGSYEASIRYSELLQYGEGVDENPEEAIKYFEKCVDISKTHSLALNEEYIHHTLYDEDEEYIDSLEDAESMFKQLKEEIENELAGGN